MAIDTRIQFPTFGNQIGQAAAAASGLGSNVLGGMQIAQRRREFDLQRADQQQAQKAAMERFAQSAQAIGSIATQIRNTQDWGEKFQILGSNPALWTDDQTRPAMQAMTNLTMQQYDVASKTGQMADMAKLSELEKMTQKEVFDTISGFQPKDRLMALSLFKSSNGQMTQDLYEFIGEAQSRMPASETEPMSVREAEAISEKLRMAAELSETDPQRSEELKREAEEIRSRFRTEGFEAQVGVDDQGRPIFSFRKTSALPGQSRTGQPTVATQSQLQQDLLQKEKALLLVNRLKGIRQEDVGVRGIIGETLIDRGLAQLIPETANKERISNRQLIRMVREALLRQVSGDPRFSNVDRQRIEEALPATGAIESHASLMEKIQGIETMIRERASIDAEELGTRPAWLMSPEELREAVKSGNMSEEDAADILLQFYPNTF